MTFKDRANVLFVFLREGSRNICSLDTVWLNIYTWSHVSWNVQRTMCLSILCNIKDKQGKKERICINILVKTCLFHNDLSLFLWCFFFFIDREPLCVVNQLFPLSWVQSKSNLLDLEYSLSLCICFSRCNMWKCFSRYRHTNVHTIKILTLIVISRYR